MSTDQTLLLAREGDDRHSELDLELCLGMRFCDRFITQNTVENMEDIISSRVSVTACGRRCNAGSSHRKFRETNESLNAFSSIAKVGERMEVARSVSPPLPRETHDQERQTDKKRHKLEKTGEKQQKMLNYVEPPPVTRYFINDSSDSVKAGKNQEIADRLSWKLKIREQEFLEEAERTQFHNIHPNRQRLEQQRSAAHAEEEDMPRFEEKNTVAETYSRQKFSASTVAQKKNEIAYSESSHPKRNLIVCPPENAKFDRNLKKSPEVAGRTAKNQERLMKETAPDLRALPTTSSSSFIRNPFGMPMYCSSSNLGEAFAAHPLPYFFPPIAAGHYGESSCISCPSSGTSSPILAVTTANNQAFHSFAARYSQKRKMPASSSHEQNHSKASGAQSKKPPKSPLVVDPLRSEISSESKARSRRGGTDFHALISVASSTLRREAASPTSESEVSGKSSSSSGVYPSAHGETAESYPPTITGSGDDQYTIHGNMKQETAACTHCADCNNTQGATAPSTSTSTTPLTSTASSTSTTAIEIAAAAAATTATATAITVEATATTAGKASIVRSFPSACGRLLVSTIINGNTNTGVLFGYNKHDVRICCECHGQCMSAREFVVHAGGEDGPHPERSIVVKFPPITF